MKKLYEESSIQEIAEAIRTKAGITSTMTVAEMPDYINSMSGGFGAEVPYDAYIPRAWLTDTTATHKAYGLIHSGGVYSTTCTLGIYLLSGENWTISINETSQTANNATGMKYLGYSYEGRNLIIMTNNTSNLRYPSLSLCAANFSKPYCGFNIGIQPTTQRNPGQCESEWIISVYNGAIDLSYYNLTGKYIVLTSTSVLTCPYSSSYMSYLWSKIWFVPDNLLSSYKSATNWSSRSDIIHPLLQCPFIE